MRPFQDAHKKFARNSSFEQILQLYEFDRELRLLCLDAIERVEVALRAAIVDTVAVKFGPHFYTDSQHFFKTQYHQDFLDSVAVAESLALYHYRSKYSVPAEPPIWAAIEAITLGTLSKFFANLQRANRTLVAQRFSYPEAILVSWFRSISVFRNVCAHHGRIWSAKFTVNMPKIPYSFSSSFSSQDSFQARAIILFCLLKDIEPAVADNWRQRLQALFDRYQPVVDKTKLGFAAASDPFWSL